MDAITDLEDRLAADTLGRVRCELQLILEDAIAGLCRRQREPQQAAQLAALGRQQLACMAAQRVIEVVWHRCHQSGR
ncbi:EscE/YscE/SsaE family type III secretion system needle protein co-chaperone [Paraburkholderia sp. RL17-373-BIF-A]|uniref:EscE/YscE/SsaE family type III secretion system needle protein co-chaperone n=1 Tax=Paraburkholderia sp. RL17-373-BIF-A TaxID=3031629 RepID=UPI0038B8C883